MPEPTEQKEKSGSTILVYIDGKPVELPVEEFLHMLEEAHV
jgi:hypothetical protein